MYIFIDKKCGTKNEGKELNKNSILYSPINIHKKLTKNDENFTNMLQNLEIYIKSLYNINIACYNEFDLNIVINL